MEEAERAFGVCGYCFRPILADESGFYSTCRIETALGFAPDDFEGKAVEVWREDDHIIAVVPGAGAEATEDGSNLMYFVCSPECGEALDAFLSLPAPVGLRLLRETPLG